MDMSRQPDLKLIMGTPILDWPGCEFPEPVGEIVASFVHSVYLDLYPPKKYERLFGVAMNAGPDNPVVEHVYPYGMPVGAIAFNAWIGFLKSDETITAEVLTEALANGSLPELFEGWVRQYGARSAYLEALLQPKVLRKVPWVVPRMCALNMCDEWKRMGKDPTGSNETAKTMVRDAEERLGHKLRVRSYGQGFDEKKCENCGTEHRSQGDGRQLLRCTRCRKARYCGVSCQRLHFKKHKLVCGK